jgi:hypothetical protein
LQPQPEGFWPEIAEEILTEYQWKFNLLANRPKGVLAAISGLEIMLKWQSANFAESCD